MREARTAIVWWVSCALVAAFVTGLGATATAGEAKLMWQKTDTSLVFHDLAEWMRRKGLVVIVIDLFDDADKILFGLQHFRHKRHEVIVFQVLDDDEIRFPFQDMTLFEGLEEMPELLSDPRALRDGYIEAFERFTDRVRSGCRNSKIDFVRVNTGDPLDVVLSAYLATRASSRNL